MTEESIETVRRFYEAFIQGDGQGALAVYAPDAEWDDTRFRPEGKVHRGREALAELVRTWVGTWADYSFTLEEVLDAGSRVVAICEERGTGKGSGLDMNTRIGIVMTVDGGEITRAVVYKTPAEALEAAGLSK